MKPSATPVPTIRRATGPTDRLAAGKPASEPAGKAAGAAPAQGGSPTPGEKARAPALPRHRVMLDAFLRGDRDYDGIFLTGVRTTGIFCRPSCPARKPRPENVEFFATPDAARSAGYRPCKRCRPLEQPLQMPDWLLPLVAAVEADPARRWRDADLVAQGLSPSRVRRWFQSHRGTTFHSWARTLRVGRALGRIGDGGTVTSTAFDHGYDSLSGFGSAARQVAGRSAARAVALARARHLDTPLGAALAVAMDSGICALHFVDREAPEAQERRLRERLRRVHGVELVPGEHDLLDQLGTELEAYFRGTHRHFEVPLAAAGTPFEQSVWAELRKIPYGTTCSYGALAATIGRPRAVRAVGRANGANPLAILTPCHRVVGADGQLTGYAGGLWRKQRLLELERNPR